MRLFHEVPGNRGYGFAVAASPGSITLGIRTATGQGEIICFETLEDLAAFKALLTQAEQEAFGQPD